MLLASPALSRRPRREGSFFLRFSAVIACGR
jgi:hypothetical protein